MTRASQVVPAEGNEGFTLVDTLVALLILAVIASLMMLFIGQFHTIRRIQQAAVAKRELDAVARFLESTIAAAVPAPLITQGDAHDVIVGEPHQLRMVGRIPTGFRTVSLRDLQIGKNASALVLRTAPRRAGPRGSNDIVINDDIAAITFDYLAPGGVWSETWRGWDLPIAIRFTLSATRADRPETVSGLALLRLAATNAQDD